MNSQVVLCDIIFIRTIFNTQIGLDILTYWSKLVCSSRVKPQVSQYLQFTQGSHQTYTVVNCIIFQCRLQALWKEGRRPNETVIGTDIYVLSESEISGQDGQVHLYRHKLDINNIVTVWWCSWYVCYISLANKQYENTKDKVEDEN